MVLVTVQVYVPSIISTKSAAAVVVSDRWLTVTCCHMDDDRLASCNCVTQAACCNATCESSINITSCSRSSQVAQPADAMMTYHRKPDRRGAKSQNESNNLRHCIRSSCDKVSGVIAAACSVSMRPAITLASSWLLQKDGDGVVFVHNSAPPSTWHSKLSVKAQSWKSSTVLKAGTE